MSDAAIDAKHEMKRGLWWMGGATLAMRVLDVAGSLLVLKFLAPGEVGLAALAWSIAVAIEAFNGLGVGQVVVRQRELGPAELSGLFWFCTLFGAAATAVVAVVAPFAAVFYADWRLYPMIVVSAAKLILVGAALVPLQLLTRELQFKTAGAVQTLATLGEAVTKVVLVIAGFGAWGLVLANVSRGLWLCLALWRFGSFRPIRAAADATTRGAVRFGFRAALASILYHGYRNLDNLFIGRALGTRVLGIYQTAFQLGMTPLEIVLQLVNRVQYPIYARLRDQPAALVEAFNRSARSLLLLLGPVAALLAFGSTDILTLLAGGKWLPAVPIIQVLVWGSLLRGISQLFPQLYNATGRPGFSVVDALITGATLVTGFLGALALAPEGEGARWVAWVWLLSYPIPLAAHFWMAARCSPVRPLPFFRELVLPAAGIGVVTSVLALASRLRPALPSPWLMLALLVVAGFGAHALFLRLALGMRLRDVLPKKQG